jgi:hypothetical protein
MIYYYFFFLTYNLLFSDYDLVFLFPLPFILQLVFARKKNEYLYIKFIIITHNQYRYMHYTFHYKLE